LQNADLTIKNGEGTVKIRLEPLASFIFKVQND